MNKKLMGWICFVAFLLMEFHPEWFVTPTTKDWLRIIAIMIAMGYAADQEGENE